MAPFLNGVRPTVVQEIPGAGDPTDVIVRRLVFQSRDQSEIFACVAKPKAPGKYPGILVIHGGRGAAEVSKVIAWAQKGYVAATCDLPGIAAPDRIPYTKGNFSTFKYGEGRWVANPDASSSVIFDAVLAAMKTLYLLRSEAEVDKERVGVVGVSWGGYMTAMICSLAGEQVRAGFALYGCGFFDLGSGSVEVKGLPDNKPQSLAMMPEEERQKWLKCLDPGHRAGKMKASYFLAAASNDFFGWPSSVKASMEAVSSEKNMVIAPNADHKIPVPGGDIVQAQKPVEEPKKEGKETAFQPLPTPTGTRGNWLSMENVYFDYYLRGIGNPFPKVQVISEPASQEAKFKIRAPVPLTKVEVYWSKEGSYKNRKWECIVAKKNKRLDFYSATLPPEASDWFVLASDERPVSVSSSFIHIEKISNKK